MAIRKVTNRSSTITVGSTEVSDDTNTSTGALDLPVGTTAQRPGSPTSGNIRFNTDLDSTELYDGTEWVKVGSTAAVLTSVSGTIIRTLASNLTLTGTGFLSAALVVNFTQSSDGINEDVTVTASSDTSATVAVPSAVYNNVTIGNVVTIKVTNSDSRESNTVNTTATGLPSGGSTSTSGSYYIHTFTTDGTFVVPSGISLTNEEYLVVAGGGGGGGNNSWAGGGGGAGGMVQNTFTSTAGTYTITVGVGGSGNVGAGSDGTNSTIVTPSSSTLIDAVGGGGGGAAGDNAFDNGGRDGGSGGGSGAGTPQDGVGQGTTGQGSNGGSGDNQSGAGGNAPWGGGGGGGKGGNGGNGSTNGGAGGTGATSSITGGTLTYAAGGGGAVYGGGSAGNGISGVSGNGASSGTGGNGTDGRGGGGGGGSSAAGGDGGNGIVVIRYQLA